MRLGRNRKRESQPENHGTEGSSRTRSRALEYARRGGLAVGIVVLALVVIVGGVAIWLGTSSGRDFVRGALVRFVSDSIAGSMEVEAVDDVSLAGIEAHGVIFLDPNGDAVIEATHVTLELQWWALLGGRFISTRGRVRGGRVWIRGHGTEPLGIDAAFRPPSPAERPGAPDAPSDEDDETGDSSDVVALRRLAASDIDVLVRVSGAPHISARSVNAILAVTAPEHRQARFRADRINTHVTAEAPAPIDLVVHDGTLTYDGNRVQRATLTLPARMDDGPVNIHVRIRQPASRPLDVAVRIGVHDVGGAIRSAPVLFEALAVGAFDEHFDVTVEVGDED